MPTAFGHDSHASFPDETRAATILQIRTPVDGELIEGSGLVVDCMPPGTSARACFYGTVG
jgi:hypothetical protein